MIFVTLGSQKFQFNRLLKQIDLLIENGIIKDKVFAQIGYSDYQPKNFSYKDFIDRDEFKEIMASSDIVISHGGTGAIITGVKNGKKVIAVPRLACYGEHVDDHQVQIVSSFSENGIIEGLYDVNQLGEVLGMVKEKTYEKYLSNTNNIIKDIEDFIDKESISL